MIPRFKNRPACEGTDTNLWFSNQSNDYPEKELLTRICNGCPARQECLEYALRYSELHGIWAGLDPTERSKLQDGKSVIPFHTTLPMSHQGWVEGVKLEEG